MLSFQKHQTKIRVMAIFVLFMFASTAFASGLSMGRIIPKGKVTLYQGNQKIGEFTDEAPLPQDTFLSVNGECGVKMSNLYLVAIDKSLFSVSTQANSCKLTVEQGTVYFALSSMPITLVFQTPEGLITTHEIMLKASADAGMLKGYVSVSDGVTKVGVLQGGSMLVSVGDSEAVRVNTNKEFRLAQAGVIKNKEAQATVGQAARPGTLSATTTNIAIIAANLGIIAGVTAAANDDHDAAASPASP
ncbi:MAG: hypothetical protein JRC88_13195 [Deltaproteobacteria bacterium]|nr:hypothetical protein [Deltaproteobacteria bacterium]